MGTSRTGCWRKRHPAPRGGRDLKGTDLQTRNRGPGTREEGRDLFRTTRRGTNLGRPAGAQTCGRAVATTKKRREKVPAGAESSENKGGGGKTPLHRATLR